VETTTRYSGLTYDLKSSFLEAVGVKKSCLAFSFQYLAICGDSWHILSDWCFDFLNMLVKSVIRLF